MTELSDIEHHALRLSRVLNSFRFEEANAGRASRGAAFAALLSAGARLQLPAVPGFFITGGLGKTRLATSIARVAHEVPTLSYLPHGKLRDAALTRYVAGLVGRGVAIIDGINEPLESPALAGFLSRGGFEYVASDRAAHELIITRTVVVITGRGPLVGSLNDFVIRIKVRDCNVKSCDEENALRNYSHEDATADACALLAAWRVIGSPQFAEPAIKNFPIWDATIRQCVLWLAMWGFIDAADPALCFQPSIRRAA